MSRESHSGIWNEEESKTHDTSDPLVLKQDKDTTNNYGLQILIDKTSILILYVEIQKKHYCIGEFSLFFKIEKSFKISPIVYIIEIRAHRQWTW